MKVLMILMSYAIYTASWATTVVSTTTSADEIIWKLVPSAKRNSTILSLSPLAGDPRYSNIAGEEGLPLRPLGANLERLASLKPDLVVVSQFNRLSYFTLLKSLGLPYLTLNDLTDFQQIFAAIELVGTKLGLTVEAKDLVKQLQTQLTNIPRQKRPIKVLVYSDNNTLPGSGTAVDAIVNAAGAHNILATQLKQSGWKKLNAEVIVGLNPERVIVTDDGPGSVSEKSRRLKQDLVWGKIPAVKQGRLIFVKSSLLSATSPFSITAASTLHQALYNEN